MVRVVPTFVVDAWVDTIYTAVRELLDRLNFYKETTKRTEAFSKQSDVDLDTLNIQLLDLQLKLSESVKNSKKLEEKNRELGECMSCNNLVFVS